MVQFCSPSLLRIQFLRTLCKLCYLFCRAEERTGVMNEPLPITHEEGVRLSNSEIVHHLWLLHHLYALHYSIAAIRLPHVSA